MDEGKESPAWHQTVKDLKDEAQKTIEDIRVRVDETVGASTDAAQEYLDMTRKVTRERPLLVLGAAFAFGMVVGMLLGRK